MSNDWYTCWSMVNDSTTDPLLLNQQAIDAALSCRWEEAIIINNKLLEFEPQRTEFLNRLAKAYFELGKYSESKKLYIQVLAIDPYNTIAEKNLKKVNSLKKDDGVKFHNGHNNIMILSPSLFLEEPGITTLVSLVKVAEPQKLLTLSPGTVVELVIKKRGVSVIDGNKQYLGAFPDDSAFHLLKLLKGGNKYQVIIKSVKPNGLTILIREIYRSKKFKNQASFLDDSRIVAISSENFPMVNDESSDDSSSDDSSQTEEPLA